MKITLDIPWKRSVNSGRKQILDRNLVLFLRENAISVNCIAEVLECSRTAVYNAIRGPQGARAAFGELRYG